MTLYTERFKAHLIIATDCTVSFNARSNNKDAGLGKYGDTAIHFVLYKFPLAAS